MLVHANLSCEEIRELRTNCDVDFVHICSQWRTIAMGAKIDKAKGWIKEKVGKATGSTRTEAEGKTDRAKGNVKEAGEKTKEAAKGVRDSIKR